MTSADTFALQAKIVKPVTFPMELDLYSLCTPELKARLDKHRKLASAKADATGAQPMDTSDEVAPMTNVSGKYELIAVLSHRGRSADSGHYVGA